MSHHQIVIVGGGSAGISVAAQLLNKDQSLDIAIIDPSQKHYYQPLWTLVGGGVFPKEETERSEGDYIPDGATWIQESVASFDPDKNVVKLNNSTEVGYDFLVVCPGIQLNWDAIPGLKESVGKPDTGVCSNYSYSTVDSTWENIKKLKSGRAIFTQPGTPIKCGGAPQKICYLASHYFKKHGYLKNIEVVFANAGDGIFAVKKYANSLNKVIERYGINTMFGHDLTELKYKEKVAVFHRKSDDSKVELSYDMIHVTPPQGPCDFVKNSPLAASTGWVDVDKYTTQHVTFKNVFSLGDSSNLPTSKTGAAIRKQAPVTVANLLAALKGLPLPARYDGYTSCPLVTGYGSLILAEFDYDGKPKESFPFDQSKERYSMYALKAYGLPQIYWHGMLQGREF